MVLLHPNNFSNLSVPDEWSFHKRVVRTELDIYGLIVCLWGKCSINIPWIHIKCSVSGEFKWQDCLATMDDYVILDTVQALLYRYCPYTKRRFNILFFIKLLHFLCIYRKANLPVVYWNINYFFNIDMLQLLLSWSLKSKPPWLYSFSRFRGDGRRC